MRRRGGGYGFASPPPVFPIFSPLANRYFPFLFCVRKVKDVWGEDFRWLECRGSVCFSAFLRKEFVCREMSGSNAASNSWQRFFEKSFWTFLKFFLERNLKGVSLLLTIRVRKKRARKVFFLLFSERQKSKGGNNPLSCFGAGGSA